MLVFACIGHFAVHLLLGLHATAALAIEREWSIDYGSVIELGIGGAFLVGAAAPAAGWLADKAGSARLMVVFFLGSGAASMTTAMAGGPASLAMTLGGLGLFAAIYHPVGLAWLLGGVAERRRGWAVGVNGLFGSLGVAAAPAAAGLLGDAWGWRAAFFLPGLGTVALGALLILTRARGAVPDDHAAAAARPAAGTVTKAMSSDSRRALVALAAAMVCGSVLYAS
ncbi:MAG: MFS transporter, partial [Solimonas sp.]